MTQPPYEDLTQQLLSRGGVLLDHLNDTPDFSRDSFHHSLGINPTQASPGNHTHLGDNISKTLDRLIASGKSLIWDGTSLNLPSGISLVSGWIGGDTVDASETTASTAYTDLTTIGPRVTRTTGSSNTALIITGHQGGNNTAGQFAIQSVAVSGATTLAANDSYSVVNPSSNQTLYIAKLITGLNAGVNTFTCKYKVTGGTGNFLRRSLVVIPL